MRSFINPDAKTRYLYTPLKERISWGQVATCFPRLLYVQKNIARYWPIVADAADLTGIGRRRSLVAYVIGTIRAEIEDFNLKAEEQVSRFNTKELPFDLYDFKASLGNKGKGDGELFRGRGAIQLTGRWNYKDMQDKLRIALAYRPEIACEPEVSAIILCCFIADKRERLVPALESGRLQTARKLINGGQNGYARFVTGYTLANNMLIQAGIEDYIERTGELESKAFPCEAVRARLRQSR